MNKMLGKKSYVACFVLPALILFISFTIIPLFISGTYSLFQYDGIGTMEFIGLGNYIRMFGEDRYFVKAILNSLPFSRRLLVHSASHLPFSGHGSGKGSKRRKIFQNRLLFAGSNIQHGNRPAMDEDV